MGACGTAGLDTWTGLCAVFITMALPYLSLEGSGNLLGVTLPTMPCASLVNPRVLRSEMVAMYARKFRCVLRCNRFTTQHVLLVADKLNMGRIHAMANTAQMVRL